MSATHVATGPHAKISAMPAVAAFTLNAMFDAFLAEQRERLSGPTFWRYEGVVDCFRNMLDSYAYTDLDPDEEKFWERRYNKDEIGGSFCNTFGPEKVLARHAQEFCGSYMIRTVLGPQDMINASGTVLKKLASWMVAGGYMDAATAKDVKATATRAAKLLPAGDKLNRLLHDVTPGLLDDAPHIVGPIYEFSPATISRIEAGELWFTGGEEDAIEIGPVKVSADASEIAQVGWDIGWLAAGQGTSGNWRILELGFVYPDI